MCVGGGGNHGVVVVGGGGEGEGWRESFTYDYIITTGIILH